MSENKLEINELGYFEMTGLNVLVFNNVTSDAHQGGVEIIQNGVRVATCGDVRLSPSYGQWQPLPKLGPVISKGDPYVPETADVKNRIIDKKNNEIRLACSYPNEVRHLKGFNPIIFPDLELSYTVRVKGEDQAFSIVVDMDQPIPAEWVGMVGFSLELFPGSLYGMTYFMDETPGIFPRQAIGPTYQNRDGEVEAVPLALGNKLIIAPEDSEMMMQVENANGKLELFDGSLKHTDGWFIIRSAVPEGATKNAIQWKITPNTIPDWKYGPVIHVSQVGYHPGQNKKAYIELDKSEENVQEVMIQKLMATGEYLAVCRGKPEVWGRYFRYQYLTYDFSSISSEGMYRVQYGNKFSNLFRIGQDVFRRGVWQPTLEIFLPVQMCHMRVSQKYRLWHSVCHMDDALMSPDKIQHFDGYSNRDYSGGSPWKSLEHIPGLNAGGWHDAADTDIRTDTQVETSLALAYIYEEFAIDYDETTIDQTNHVVEIHQPDGKPDILQQLEHGMIWLRNFYNQMGVIGMGIIVPTLRQDCLICEPGAQTDNRVFDDKDGRAASISADRLWYKNFANRYSAIFDPQMCMDEIKQIIPDLDDRLVFLQENAGRQLYAAAGFAAAARVMKAYDDSLAEDCLRIAKELWQTYEHCIKEDVGGNKLDYITDLLPASDEHAASNKIYALTELILATGEPEYIKKLLELQPLVVSEFAGAGWAVGRVMKIVGDECFSAAISEAARNYRCALDKAAQRSPFGCFAMHNERIGMQIYFLNKSWPEIFSPEILFNVIQYLLGCHAGDSTNSLVSGVGAHSATVTYSQGRADWSYVPGATFWNAVNRIMPDFFEDKEWPFLWQEREYITNLPAMYMFDIMAADKLLSGSK